MSEIEIASAPAPENALPTATDETVILPNPIQAEGEKTEEQLAADKAAAEPKKRTVRESVEAAAAKVEAKDKEAAKDGEATSEDKAAADAKAKADAKAVEGKTKDPKTGKFVAKEPTPADPPARFVAEAKTAWAATPDPVKAEVHRTIKNLEAGITEHAKRWEPLKEYDDLAKKSGTTLDRALKEYIGIDKQLGENFPAAMQRICANKGVDIRAFAADVLQLPPAARQQLRIGGQPQAAPVASPEVLDLRRKVAALEQQVTGVTGNIQQRQSAETERQVSEFAADKPLFSELSAQIAAHIANSGLSLPDAYAKAYDDFTAMAERAGFSTRTQSPVPQPRVQNPGSKSIKGAPGLGSSPATRKPSSSIREAILRAAQAVG